MGAVSLLRLSECFRMDHPVLAKLALHKNCKQGGDMFCLFVETYSENTVTKQIRKWKIETNTYLQP